MSETLSTAKTNINYLQAETDKVMLLGDFSVRYAQVERRPRYENGRRENDAEHSQMLGMIAVQLAYDHYPFLDSGLIMQFSAVHDYPEIYTGDVPTLGISDHDRAKKEAAEAVAAQRLTRELPQPWSGLLARYEQQQEPETRFVRLVDKLLPPIVQYYGDGVGVFNDDYGIYCRQQLEDLHQGSSVRLRMNYPEFEQVHDIRDVIVERMKHKVFEY